VLDVPAGMRVREKRCHDRVDVLVGVGVCCGDCGEWIVDGGGKLLSLLFTPKIKKGVPGQASAKGVCLLSPSAIYQHGPR
jgi:hypothetical protein